MILRKPYAFFIKIFKPIHIFMSGLIAFLIYRTNNILSFFNEYIHSNDSVIKQSITEKLISGELFIIPIVMIVFCLIFLGIMFNKKKPIFFYIFTIFAFLIVIITTIYAGNFLNSMEKVVVSIKMVKLMHDLIVLNMIVEIIVFIFLIIRGLGINFKKFNFDSDVTKLDISDLDKEEFELSINIDVDAARSKRKRKLRYLKYIYKENKLIINLAVTGVAILLVVICFASILMREKILTEGDVYNLNKFNMIVNNSKISKENYKGKILTENNLIIVDISLQSNFEGVSLFKKDFSLQIGDAIFYSDSKYDNEFKDLGNTYNNNVITSEYEHYLFVFEVPDKYLTSDMFFTFNDQGNKRNIKLEPKNLIGDEIIIKKQITESIEFEKTLGKISFNIDSYNIENKFLIRYNFCLSKEECLISNEYIEPTINENFDKAVLRLSLEYKNESKLKLDSFYEFFSSFGAIEYKIGDKWFVQNSKFEELKSKKVNNKKNVYIGVNSGILSAESIKLVFNIRNSKYEYLLK